MTKETWDQYNKPTAYAGKHVMKHYNIWRVLGPHGPEERFTVCGLEAASECIVGCWDWEVTDMNGNRVPDKILIYYPRKERNYACGTT